jgi:phospholipid-binding lipoprotein MlaA
MAEPAVPDLGPVSGQLAFTPASSPEDPLEGTNRRLYGLNLVLDRFLFRPVAVTYRRLLPKPVRKGIHNALRNWDEPGVAVNDVLQLRFSDAGRAAYRFGLNTTVGLAGFFDVATGHGVIHHENGFGLTMARYGIGNGPYMYLPFAGPSTTRQLFGALVDIGTNPLTNIRHIRSKTLESVQSVVSVVDTRATLDDDLHDIAVTATDPYASIRSIYLQTLESQVRGDMISLEDSPDIPGAPELPDRRKLPEAGPRSAPVPPSDTPPKTPPAAAPTAAPAGPVS